VDNSGDRWGWLGDNQRNLVFIHRSPCRSRIAPRAVHRPDTPSGLRGAHPVHTINTTYYCYWFYLSKSSPFCNPGDELLGPWLRAC